MPGLLQALLGNSPAATQRRAPGFRSHVQVTDGDTAYDTAAEILALITGTAHADFRLIWERTVKAQTRVSWGYGSPGLPQNQGFLWFASADAGTDVDIGVLRLQQSNNRGTRTDVVAELPDGALHSATNTSIATLRLNDRQTMVALPEKIDFDVVREDSKLQLTYALITAATTHDVVGFEIPITVYQ